MKGQWNFETRSNTETKDPRFAGKSFVSGIEGEGNVVAALYDAIDTTNENTLDDQSGQLRNIWNTIRDNKERGESVITSDFMEFKNDWDDSSRPSLDNIFRLNTLLHHSHPTVILHLADTYSLIILTATYRSGFCQAGN